MARLRHSLQSSNVNRTWIAAETPQKRGPEHVQESTALPSRSNSSQTSTHLMSSPEETMDVLPAAQNPRKRLAGSPGKEKRVIRHF